MQQTKHTPGPWSVPHFAKPDVDCECGYVLTGGYMGAVCTVHVSGDGEDWQKHGDNPRFEEACANARLIAASPDLLEALRAAMPGLRSLHQPDNPIVLAAEAAIAKATGSAS